MSETLTNWWECPRMRRAARVEAKNYLRQAQSLCGVGLRLDSAAVLLMLTAASWGVVALALRALLGEM